MSRIIPVLYAFVLILMGLLAGFIAFVDDAEMAFRVMQAMTIISLGLAASSFVVACVCWWAV